MPFLLLYTVVNLYNPCDTTKLFCSIFILYKPTLMAKGRPKLLSKPEREAINIQVLKTVKAKLRELHSVTLSSDVAVISDLIEKAHAKAVTAGQ